MALFDERRETLRAVVNYSAMTLFREKGYDNVTIADITERIGVAKGTFYNCFSSKSEVLMLWGEYKIKSIKIKKIMNKNINIENNLKNYIRALIKIVKAEQTLSLDFLKELKKVYFEDSLHKRLNFKEIIFKLISNSVDFTEVGEKYLDIKIKVLINSLYQEALNHLYSKGPLEELEVALDKIVIVCLQGLLKNIE